MIHCMAVSSDLQPSLNLACFMGIWLPTWHQPGNRFCRFGGKLEKLEFAPRACILLHRASCSGPGANLAGDRRLPDCRPPDCRSQASRVLLIATNCAFQDTPPRILRGALPGTATTGLFPLLGNIRFRKMSPLPF